MPTRLPETPDEVTPARRRASGTFGRVLENAGWLAGGKGVGAILSLVYLGLATRSLGPHDFGQFVLVLGSAQATAAFVTFQTWQLVVRFGMDHLHADRRDQLDRLVAFAITLDLGGAIVGCALAAAGVTLLGSRMGWSATLQWQALLFCWVILLSVRSAATGILRLHDRFALGAAADTATPVMRLIGALVVLATGPSIAGFLVAWAVAEMTTAAVTWLFVRRATGHRYHWPHPRNLLEVPRENPGLWHFAGITNAGSTLRAVSKQFAVLVVGFMAGPVAAGGYRLAHQLGQALAKTADFVARAMFAEFARARVSFSRAQHRRLLRNASLSAVAAGMLIAAILILFGRSMLGLVAGKDYLQAYPVLLLLGIAASFEVAGVSYEPMLMTSGHAGLAFRLRLVTTAVLVAGLFLLLPVAGAVGAGWAMLISSALAFLLFGIAAWRISAREGDEPAAASA